MRKFSVLEGGELRRNPGSRGAKLRQSLLTDVEPDDIAAIETIETICNAVDRLDLVERRIAADGVMIGGQRGARPHPLLQVESQLRRYISRSLAKFELGM